MKSALYLCLAAAFLGAGFAPAARADNYCIDQCFSTWGCATKESEGEDIGNCVGGRSACVAKCAENPEPPPQHASGAYGAIAYDEKSGAWGLADASQDKRSAKESAMAYCSQHGKDCEIEDTFKNTCVAVAAGVDSGAFAWADDDDMRTAGLKAISKCGGKTKGPRCFLQLWHCYSD